jgi:subtilase family serine protease
MSATTRYRYAAVIAGLALAAGMGVPAAAEAGSAVSGTARVQLPGAQPAWAVPRADRGPVSGHAAVTAQVYLAGRDPAGLAAYARAVSSPGSRSYHRYLTPARTAARFGVSAAAAAAVTTWLRRAGLTVTGAGPEYIDVAGTASAARAAFGVRLDKFAVGGRVDQAPAGEITVPAALSSSILGVAGLSSVAGHPGVTAAPGAGQARAPAPARSALTRRTRGGTVVLDPPEPCSDYWGQNQATTLPPAYGGTAPYQVCGYKPAQLRSAYGVARTGLTGSGTTVAVIDAYASPTMSADLSQYSADMGEGALRPGQYSQVLPSSFAHVTDGLCGAMSNWYRDESITVDGVHAMAPGARITYVAAASCVDSDLIAAVDTAVASRVADIVSIPWHLVTQASWGTMPASDIDAFEQAFELGAVEGMGFYAAAGNCGDESLSLLCSADLASAAEQTEYPASDPWVTAVGGTTLAVGARGQYEWETSWSTINAHVTPAGTGWQIPSTYFVGGGGGGVSGSFSQPFYQRHVVPAALATSHPDGTTGAPMRVIPDVSMLGDYFNGLWYGQTVPGANGVPVYTETGFGGSGAAAGLFAGVQADAEQAQHGIPIGFANPALYARSGTADYHDITDHPLGAGQSIGVVIYNPAENAYALDTVGQDGDLHAVPGFDDATGLGSPTRAYLESYRWW